MSHISIIANSFSNSFSVKKTIFSLVALVITLIMVEPTNAVNPLEMYVGAPEGVAIYRSKDGVDKVFPNVIYLDYGFQGFQYSEFLAFWEPEHRTSCSILVNSANTDAIRQAKVVPPAPTPTLDTFELIMRGWLFSILGGLGIVANILIIIVLRHRKMKSSISLIMMGKFLSIHFVSIIDNNSIEIV